MTELERELVEQVGRTAASMTRNPDARPAVERAARRLTERRLAEVRDAKRALSSRQPATR